MTQSPAGARAGLRPDRLVYLAAYLLLMMKFMFSASLLIPWPAIVEDVTDILFLCLMGLKLLSQRYTVGNLIGIAAVAGLCVYSSVSASYTSPLLSLLLILSLQDVDFRRVLRVGCCFKGAVILLHVVCYGVVMASGYDGLSLMYRDGEIRHAFLLSHPNLFSAYLLWTTVEAAYIHYERLRPWHIGCLLLVNIATFRFTDSRSSLYTALLVSALILMDKIGAPFFRELLRLGAKYGFALCSAATVVLTVIYTPSLTGAVREFWQWLNDLFTGRLVFGAYGYNTYGHTWLGRTLNMPEKVYYMGHWLDGVIFDNSYQWLFLVYGSVFLILISLVLFVTSRHMTNMERIIIIIYALYALMENYVVNVIICFPLLIIGQYIYRRRAEPSPHTAKEETVPLWKQKSA